MTTGKPWTDFERLIVRYADGRRLCNCSNAYYNQEGRCEGGCESNCYQAKEEIGKRAYREIIARGGTPNPITEADPDD